MKQKVNSSFLRSIRHVFNFGPYSSHGICTNYQNISSCVVNNGFSTGPFDVVQRGVREGDLLPPVHFDSQSLSSV